MTGSKTITARGAATRARIVKAAADLIYAQGVDRTSLDDVMLKSGASKSQLYHYFADKDALVLEVIALQSERVLSAQPDFGALDSIRALKEWRNAIVALTVRRRRAAGCPIGSLANELSNQFESARLALADSFESWRSRIESGLQLMKERGDLSPSANPHDLALALLTALQGGLLMAKTAHSSRPLEIALDMAIEHVASHSTSKRAPGASNNQRTLPMT